MIVPWLPDGFTTVLDGRGEVFYRSFRHADRSRPTVLLLHGWTASADTQFFAVYEAIARRYSILAIDHRGHGRGMRDTFTLEGCADDVAALIDQLGIGPVVAVGYSMGGPIAVLLTRRHPQLVSSILVQATAMEWSATRLERVQWRFVGVFGLWMRSRWQRRTLRLLLNRLHVEQPALGPYLTWLEGEVVRNDPVGLLEAGRALRHYDARPFAAQLAKPAASLITTADRLVRPRKQRQLAEALGATVRELHADHLAPMVNGEQYAALTLELLDLLTAQTGRLPVV